MRSSESGSVILHSFKKSKIAESACASALHQSLIVLHPALQIPHHAFDQLLPA
jgi:hypothetical protein